MEKINWTKFDDKLPDEGEVILCIQHEDYYKDNEYCNSNYSSPRIMRFSKEAFDNEGHKPDQSFCGTDMYCYSVYWASANIPQDVVDVKKGHKKLNRYIDE